MAARVGTGVQDLQSASATSVASPTKTTTTGNLLVCVLKWEAAQLVLTGLTDTAGNTWNIIHQADRNTGLPSGAMAYAANITGHASNVVTASFSSACEWRGIIVEEFSGLATSSVLDGSYQVATGTTADYATSNITTSTTGLVVLGVADFSPISNFSGAAGTPDFSIGATNDNTAFFYLVSGSAQTVTPSASADDNQSWVAIAQAFKDASGSVNTDYSPAAGAVSASGQVLLINPQLIAPTADGSTGNWTPSDGTAFYAMVDESAADSADYIQSGANPSSDTITMKLATVTDPDTDNGFHLQFQAQSVTSSGTLVVSLRQGNSPGTEIASWSVTPPTGSWLVFDKEITSTQAGNITDFSDLYVRLVAS